MTRRDTGLRHAVSDIRNSASQLNNSSEKSQKLCYLFVLCCFMVGVTCRKNLVAQLRRTARPEAPHATGNRCTGCKTFIHPVKFPGFGDVAAKLTKAKTNENKKKKPTIAWSHKYVDPWTRFCL